MFAYYVSKYSKRMKKEEVVTLCQWSDSFDSFADEIEKVIVSPESEKELISAGKNEEEAILLLDDYVGTAIECSDGFMFSFSTLEKTISEETNTLEEKYFEEIAQSDWGLSLSKLYLEFRQTTVYHRGFIIQQAANNHITILKDGSMVSHIYHAVRKTKDELREIVNEYISYVEILKVESELY